MVYKNLIETTRETLRLFPHSTNRQHLLCITQDKLDLLYQTRHTLSKLAEQLDAAQSIPSTGGGLTAQAIQDCFSEDKPISRVRSSGISMRHALTRR